MYAVGYLHRDLSPGNIIIVGGRGYLIDWDFAKSTKTEAPRRITRTVCQSIILCSRSMNNGQGTWPFMSANLVEDASAAHMFQDDLESSLWLLLWTTIMFTQLLLSIERRSKFMRETFELGGQQKRSVLLSQTILDRDTYCDDFPNDPQPPLFPNQCSLYLLLRDLVDLFHNCYWRPEPADWRTLATVEKFVAAQGDIMQDIRENLPAYRYQQFQKRLQDHRYMIKCFARHLQGNDWPQGDKAVKQELTQVDFWEMEGMSKVTLLQSKHILESVDAEEEKQLRPKKA